jgi:hypothetical protein
MPVSKLHYTSNKKKYTINFRSQSTFFTRAKLWKQPRCHTIDEWIKKMWYLYAMEFYQLTKQNEILSFASKWMELENIILSEVSQVQKVKFLMFSLICGI